MDIYHYQIISHETSMRHGFDLPAVPELVAWKPTPAATYADFYILEIDVSLAQMEFKRKDVFTSLMTN